VPQVGFSLQRSTFILLILCAGVSLSRAQTTFERAYGGIADDFGYSVQQTSDGGYIVAGNTISFGAGSHDVYLVKTNSSGDTLWTRTYGGASYDYGYFVQQTSDSGYILAGYTNSFGAGSYDVYLVKTNSSGDTLWTRTYGGTGRDAGASVQQTSDGGYIVAGYTNSFGAGAYDVYLVRTNSSGDTLWTRTCGGADNDGGNSVQQTSDSGYIVAGYTESFGVGSGDVYLVKTNSSGDTLWTRTYGGASYDRGYSVQQTSDGGYIVAGSSNFVGATPGDVYLIKTKSSGDTLWTRAYGGASYDRGYSVQQTSDGGYIFAGETYSFGAGAYDVYLIKTLGDGTLSVQDYRTVMPAEFALLQNYPNPFNPATVIRYQIPVRSKVTVKVCDLLGRNVATLVDEVQEAGDRSVEWDASGMSSGVYFYRLQAGVVTQSKKLILLR
jgi:hypothetical protein